MTETATLPRTAPEDCPACGQQTWRYIFRKLTADYWRCGSCGLVRQYPLPTDAQLHEHYKEIHETGICSLYLQHEEMRKGIFEYWWKLLESAADFSKKGKLLDVGCSSGTQMEVAEKHGWDVYGVEPTLEASERAKKRFGTKIFQGFLHDAKYPSNHFDMVTLFDVFEHFPNPGPIFDEVARIIRPGGRLVISTADTGTVFGRLLGKNWFLYIPHEHLFYCNRSSMTRLLKRRGMYVIAIRRAVKQMSIYYAVNALKFLGPGFHRLLNGPLRLLPEGLRNKNIPLYGGEMLVLAEKQQST